MDYCEIGVHFFQKNKGIVKKGHSTNNFQYRLNFSKKNIKSKLLSGKQFFSTQVSSKRQKTMVNGKIDVKPCSELSE